MKVFTTGQAAKLCKVSKTTIRRWFDSGKLKGYRIPGTNNRRIPREYLVKLLKETGKPLGDLAYSVLVISQNDTFVNHMAGEMGDVSIGVAIESTSMLRDAEDRIHREKPSCVLLDGNLGSAAIVQLYKRVASDSLTFVIVRAKHQVEELFRFKNMVSYPHNKTGEVVAERTLRMMQTNATM